MNFGQAVKRIAILRGKPEWNHGQRGHIIEVTETRTRIMWLHSDGSTDRRTWLANDALGKRWELAID